MTDVACGQWPTIEPASLPPLPWHLVVVRKDSGGTIWSGDVTDLPAYFLQLGPDGTLSTVYPMGPPGPVCPTDLASPLPGQMAYLLLRLNVRFWPLTADQLAQVTVTAAQAAQTAYDSIGGQIPGSSTCEFLGLFMNATPGGPSPSITRPAYLVLTVGRRDSNFTDARMQFVDAVTGQLLHSYSPDANTASQFGYNCGPQPA